MNNTCSLARTVLCLADTKLVLGNVCAATVFNGRSLGDFATLLAIAGTSFGAARSLYRWLESQGQSYAWLERGRGPDEIASMDVLDAPPQSWVDLMATVFLAEAATSTLAGHMAQRADPFLANQVRMLGRDSAFHMAYCKGWLKVLAEDERDALQASLRARLPLALRWVRSADPQSCDAFADACAPVAALGAEALPAAAEYPLGWNAERARAWPLPDRLWDIVRFKDAELLA